MHHNDAYYGAVFGTPMHPDRARWLREEQLFYVDVRNLVTLYNLPRPRQARIVRWWDEYDHCKRYRTWADNSPMASCTIHPIACDACLSSRHVIVMLGEDALCPQSTDPLSDEACMFSCSEEGLCDDCISRKEFGCGHGSHVCASCVVDAHVMENVVTECVQCGECINPLCLAAGAWEYHCRAVCPRGPACGHVCG